MGETRTLVLRALVQPRPDRFPGGHDLEGQLRRIIAEVSELELEVAALSDALADFAARYERAVGEALRELAAAENLVRRLRGLEDDLGALAERLRHGGAPLQGPMRAEQRRRAGSDRPRANAAAASVPGATPMGGTAQDPAAGQTVVGELALKRLYRQLARRLHPDLVEGGERAEFGALMARANAAYAERDLNALILLAEKVSAGEPLADLSVEERRAHLERRIEALTHIARALERQRERLLASDTERLRQEAALRQRQGGDYFVETRSEAEEEAAAARAEAQLRWGRLARAAANLSDARSTAMSNIVKSGPSGARRAFDPLRETEIVRMGAARLGQGQAGAAARTLARGLEAAAPSAPWEVALTLLAFFAEDAGGKPPEALASAAGWATCWHSLRPAWPGAPELVALLARLPAHLALGARTQGEAIIAGPQLAGADLLAGVRLAMERDPAVATIAGKVLAALGPRRVCPACAAEGPARHLLRTRGLDELHGLICPGCAAVLRSYWHYGHSEGLEALAPHALQLGLVAEASVELAGTSIGFQLLPAQRQALTAARICQLFEQLYLVPYEIDLPGRFVTVSTGAAPLPRGARVPAEGARLVLKKGAPLSDVALLETLRVRIERRFRP